MDFGPPDRPSNIINVRFRGQAPSKLECIRVQCRTGRESGHLRARNAIEASTCPVCRQVSADRGAAAEPCSLQSMQSDHARRPGFRCEYDRMTHMCRCPAASGQRASDAELREKTVASLTDLCRVFACLCRSLREERMTTFTRGDWRALSCPVSLFASRVVANFPPPSALRDRDAPNLSPRRRRRPRATQTTPQAIVTAVKLSSLLHLLASSSVRLGRAWPGLAGQGSAWLMARRAFDL